ncbi:branched-chain amino acid ABC transporter permease [Rhodoplanes sp. TEM]|uniref:Branched-chain amino acid ABC transporter permease n=1 Tax=Rhodoplanes tepidamans TaxID=200616 RepID=A0ABT5JCZ5_RHOTP|nr:MULTISPECIES: branched-chain amino acid ABC transporter permease [Rhodoplanes]MDC7787558.1 branched-chain amino acid ABC transporter permease [Rhodoplanes tepidamans]MDC7984949.1 branched-chain amino acid ABC transporter permease [Rhodoplanes sp. TEM]MDQ0357987.1 branched-chain amino acid transport system permease protein [Rhodoplanes tepidamans]
MSGGAAAWIGRGGLALLGAALLAVPFVLPELGYGFWVNIVTEILIWSLLAASVNLLFGYVGLLSFGQALFFGFGMYGATLAVIHWEAGFWTGLLAGTLAATAMAAVAGALAVRLTWHYFAIITVVFSLIFYFAAMSNKTLTGGDDGLSFSAPAVFDMAGVTVTLADPLAQYFSVLGVVAACYAIMGVVVRSPLGLAFAAVRENDRRARLIGIDVYRTRLVAFVLAGALAGVSGALFAFFGRYASASYMVYHVSGEAVVWAIVGGIGTLLGPLFGTALLIVFRELVSTVWENYLFAVGGLTVLVVMFAPLGLAGLWRGALGRLTAPRAAPAEAPADPVAPSADARAVPGGR